MNGVTSKGIFSRSETRPTGLVFNISIWPDQGSTLTRPPRGSAAMTTLGCEPEAVEGAEPGRSEAGGAATLDGEKVTRLPICGLMRPGRLEERDCRTVRKALMLAVWSLYGELAINSAALV